jgi:DNA-binding response OmpR family regulator
MNIRSIKHRGLRRFIEDNDPREIRGDLVNRTRNILTVLMTRPTQLVSRRELVESLYPTVEYTGGFRVLDVHISNIRSKLTSTTNPTADIITSVYGVGYVYNGVKPRV